MDRSQRFLRLVCSYTDVSEANIYSKNRKREFVEARQIYAYFLLFYTERSQWNITYELGYKDHASVWRVRSVIPDLLLNKEYFDKYNALFKEGKLLHAEIKKEELRQREGIPGEVGDVCWFWNDNTMNRFPVLGTLESIKPTGGGNRYVSMEHPGYVFTNCVYAGVLMLPELFRERVTEKSNLPVPWNFYYKANIGALCTA